VSNVYDKYISLFTYTIFLGENVIVTELSERNITLYLDRVLGYVLLLAVSNSSSLEAISDSLIIKVNDNNVLKSTCDVNLLSKLAIILKEWRVIVLFVLLRSHKEQTI
jgi:hypothetical protein